MQKSEQKFQWISRSALALLLFIALNALAAHWQLFPKISYESPFHSWSYWSVHQLRCQPVPNANVALLGSSLMVTAISECDALVGHQRLDLTDYRRAAYLDKLLHQSFGGQYRTINLSAPGQMPSDAYLTLQAALAHGLNPALIVYGVAPRDFIDGTLQSAADTEAFKYLSGIVDVDDDCMKDIETTPMGRLDWLLRQRFYFYRHSADVAMQWQQVTLRALDKTFFALLPHPSLSLLSRSAKPFLPNYKPFDIAPGTLLASAAPERSQERCIDNTQDYKDRYKNPDMGIYRRQMFFLQRLADLCKEQNVRLILVNMPITRGNVDLLDQQVHARYLGDLRALAASNAVEFVDACHYEQYDPQDYRDSVHLNGFGGKKFLDNLVMQLHGERACAQAILDTGKSHPQRQLASSRPPVNDSGLQ